MAVYKIAWRLTQRAKLASSVQQDACGNRISTHLLFLLTYVINIKTISDRKVFQYRMKLSSITKQKVCLFFGQTAW